MHLFAEDEICINIPESDCVCWEKEFAPSDVVIYHVDKMERPWLPKVLSISRKAKVFLFTSSLHLRFMAISNIIAMIDEDASLEIISSTIRDVYTCNTTSGKREIYLTVREHYVLAETARGTPSYIIARLLDISVKTVSSYRRSGYRKLGIRNIQDIFLPLSEYNCL
jgi:DNA-binding CsgD family transcriptional regulator